MQKGHHRQEHMVNSAAPPKCEITPAVFAVFLPLVLLAAVENPEKKVKA